METIKIVLHTLGDTEKLGFMIGSLAAPGDVVCLDGQLGAGKTALSQAIGRGLELAEDSYVTSPSFAILHEYRGRIPMYHMDFYRLEDESEVEDLGFVEYFYLEGLTVIEWSKRAMDILPQERINIELDLLPQDLARTATIVASKRYAKMLVKISQVFFSNL